MSTPNEQHPNDGSSRERSLPPIREVFRAELGSAHSSEYTHYHQHQQQQQRQHGHYDSANESSSHPFSGASTSEGMYYHGQAPGRAPGSSNSPPSGGYSYGVLRTSGPSGILTNAIPPSTQPQGIIRQTSYPTSHEGEEANKRYGCEYCGKRFGMPSHLQIHLRTHTADRPFHCTWPGCNKSFTVKSNLTRHAKAHEK